MISKSNTSGRCYDFKNIFAPKFSETIASFYKKNNHNIGFQEKRIFSPKIVKNRRNCNPNIDPCSIQNGATFVRNKSEETVEDEEDSVADYNEIIRDTGPVASMGTSCATSLAPSDDEDQVPILQNTIFFQGYTNW
jgi:hypothetical protein